jgi:hypothetical protein
VFEIVTIGAQVREVFSALLIPPWYGASRLDQRRIDAAHHAESQASGFGGLSATVVYPVSDPPRPFAQNRPGAWISRNGEVRSSDRANRWGARKHQREASAVS